MTIIKCKMCGGDIALSADKTFGFCEYCGSGMTLPNVDTDQRAAAYNRGNHFRRIGEFDKALAVYEKIVSENDQDAEAHWCCALCRFGIEYVEDPNTMEWFPTCHRVSFDSFLEDVDYKAAVANSDGITKRQYVKEGLKIAEVQKGILLTSQNTQPYDIFLCYKESDDRGNRTRDSLLAQEIYYQLTEQGRRVFYSRITLENVAGTAYEPYIFAALNSAKVMIVVGTKPEYLNAPWVKNEWSRFLTLMKKDRTKLMLPCYRDMDPYDLPEQLGILQSYDMSRIGFLPDLTRGISKVLDNRTVQQETVIWQQNTANAEPLLRRAFLFLEDGDWKTADEYCEKVLDTMPENAEAYLGKLMAEKHIRKRELLGQNGGDFAGSANYQKALRFGDDSMKAFLESAQKDATYYAQKRKLNEMPEGQRSRAFLEEMISGFKVFSGWRDADLLAESCREEIRKLVKQERIRQETQKQKEEQRRKAAEKKAKQVKKVVGILISAVCAVLAAVILANSVVIPMQRNRKTGGSENTAATESEVPAAQIQPLDPREAAYLQAETLAAEGHLGKAAIAFGKLGDYKDAREQAFAMWQKVPYRQTVCTWDTENGEKMIHALAQDGSVLVDAHTCEYCGSVANVDLEEYHTSSYRNVVSLQASRYGVIGLCYDGTLFLPDSKDPYYRELEKWEDLVGISVTCSKVNNEEHDVYFGIKADGTVVSAGTNKYGVREVESWRNIVSVASSGLHTLGLKSDGTVVASGLNYDSQCEVEDWADVISIVTASHGSFGLKANGTMATAGSDPGGVKTKVSKWTDIAVLQQNPCREFPMAFQQDGSFLGNWHMGTKMTNVAAVYPDSYHTILILKKDGTLWGGSVSAGSRAAEWKDIQVPGAPNNPAGNGKNAAAVYDSAEKLLTDGEIAKAAIAFGKLGDYRDARERSFALWRKITPGQIGCSTDIYTAAVKKDGTVMLFDYTDARQRQCLEWTDIVAVSSTRASSGGHTVGLKKDGTVVAAGANQCNQCDTSSWSDVIAIDATGHGFTVGLKADGTVLYTGSSLYGHETQIQELSSWKDIVSIYLFYDRVVGIKSDGTIVTARLGEDGLDEKIKNWTDIIAISDGFIPYEGNCYFGVKADGTVVCSYDDYQSKVSGWTDIIAISGGFDSAIGLKSDGTVVSFGEAYHGDILDLSDWCDIAVIYAGQAGPAIGAKNDGSMVFAGQEKYLPSELIKNWTDVKLPE